MFILYVYMLSSCLKIDASIEHPWWGKGEFPRPKIQYQISAQLENIKKGSKSILFSSHSINAACSTVFRLRYFLHYRVTYTTPIFNLTYLTWYLSNAHKANIATRPLCIKKANSFLINDFALNVLNLTHCRLKIREQRTYLFLKKKSWAMEHAIHNTPYFMGVYVC